MVTFAKAAKATGSGQNCRFISIRSSTMGLGTSRRRLDLRASTEQLLTSSIYPNTPANKAYVQEFRKAYSRYPQMFALFGYSAGHLIEQGFKKAGSMDKEKFVSALEGIGDRQPRRQVGDARLRPSASTAHDIREVVKKAPNIKDFLIAGDIVTIPFKDYMPTCEEVLKTRKHKDHLKGSLNGLYIHDYSAGVTGPDLCGFKPDRMSSS